MTKRRILAAAVVVLASVPDATAQVFGTFPWQMQPYCNIVRLTLTSTPAGFTLDGTDDQCGAADKASAVGVAAFNALGNVTINFTIVTAPAGKPVHVSAIVSPANGTGTWTDSVGNTGTFAFFGSAAGLPPRPFPPSALPPAIITSTELAPGAVTGAKVADGSLSSDDLADPTRANFAGGEQQVELTGADTVVRTVGLIAPVAGRVLVHASGYAWFRDTSNTAELARCSITTGSTMDGSHLIYMNDGGAIREGASDAFGAVRGFEVAAGRFTANLVCDEFAGDAIVSDTSMTALFVAQ